MSNFFALFCTCHTILIEKPFFFLKDDSSFFNATTPDFTECFRYTVLTWAPCFFLFIVSPFYVVSLYYSDTLIIPHNWLNIAKTVSTNNIPPICRLLLLSFPLLLKLLYWTKNNKHKSYIEMAVKSSVIIQTFGLIKLSTNYENS